jgi:mRNA interferase HicA
VKRRDLERHLREHGCRMVDEGGKHTKWAASEAAKRATVPRHREIDFALARAICKQLGVPPPAGPR